MACREAYGLMQSAFKNKLLESGFTKAKSEELAQFIIASIEGGILLSRTYHTADPLRLVAKHLRALLTV